MNLGANTLFVLAGCATFGALAGAVGTLVIARRHALVADVAAHATLPGVVLAFLAGEAVGLGGRTPWLLFAGAFLTAVLAAVAVAPLARLRRVGPDGATATLLAFSFGLGAALLPYAQAHASGAQGGLRSLLLGSAALMRADDLATLAIWTLLAGTGLVLLFKEFALVAFDEGAARLLGLPVRWIDLALTAIMTATVVAGLEIAGVVLVVSLLLAPAAAARAARLSLAGTTLLAATLGAAVAAAGVAMSLRFESLPTGATIAVLATTLFLATTAFGGRMARPGGAPGPVESAR